jgi:hypothetical protein
MKIRSPVASVFAADAYAPLGGVAISGSEAA